VQGLQTPTITSGPSATTNSPNATFAFSDADPTLALVCSLDGAPFTSCASPLSYSGLADGTHSFQVEALDSIGDASAAASASWTVDTAAPAVSLAAPANGATPNVFPTFTGTGGTASGDAGSVLINVYSGSSPSGSLTEAVPASLGASGAFSALSTSLLQPGVYTAQAKQLDAAGNVGLSSAATFTVGDPVILAAGDIAGCDFDFADAKATGALLNTVPDALVVPLGDNAYPHGQPSEYQNCYGTTWGSALGRTRPIVGGHDFDNVAGGATPGSGYLGYFASNLAPFGPTATDPTKLYYSYDVGTWHVVVLNDGCLEGYTPGCNEKGQEQWLINDLATHPAPCTLALYHEPRWSSGNIHGDTQPTEAFWNILYQ
jgi:hypothetical protein